MGSFEEICLLKTPQRDKRLRVELRLPEYFRKLNVLVDSGATVNAMSAELAQQLNIKRYEIERPYWIRNAEGKTGIWVTERTSPTTTRIQGHTEELAYDIVDMAKHDIILGMPWLEEHNPRINWTNREIRMSGCRCLQAPQPGPDRRRRSDEENHMCAMEPQEVGVLTAKTPTRQRLAKGNQLKKARGQEELKNLPDIPKRYAKWMPIFIDEKGPKALSKHQPWDHEIKLIPGKRPPFGPLYKSSAKELKFLKEWIKDNLEKGFIRKSQSSAASPILFIPKKDGKLRLCVDYRALNAVTQKNRYPLPSVQELRDRTHGAKWFTKIDQRWAYNLIRMKEGEEWKTAFRTRYGLFESTVMPFGLTNAPATEQELMNDIFRDRLDDDVIVYLDDTLIYSSGTEEDHAKRVEDALRRFTEYGLRLNAEKCEFHKKEVEFLGHIVGNNEVKVTPNRAKAIAEWPRPTNVTKVQSFLGLVNFDRQFVEKFSHKAEPLTRLTKKNQKFNWAKEQENAFQGLKKICSSPQVLRTYDPDKPVRIQTDASDLALGACLLQQNDNGKWCPVAYYSRKMTPAEQNYGIEDKELLAIVAALQEWHIYVEGAVSTEVFTDHENLLTWTTTKKLNRRQVRWSELLGRYHFSIKRVAGKDNGRADAISRRPDLMDREPKERTVLKINDDGSLSAANEEFLEVMEILQDNQEQFPVSRNKLHIPQERIWDCIRMHHDSPEHGHGGITNTIKAIQRNCHFKDMKKHVTEFVKQCEKCQKNKHSTHKKYTTNMVIEQPGRPWQSITMDFITKLPKSKDPITEIEYDAIWVIVDRYSKWVHCIPFREDYDSKKLHYLWMDRVVRIRGHPDEIISDRDKLFTSSYWKTLQESFGTKLKHSTAYHPQTDGQTERANQTLEQYLRHYVNRQMNNWVELLPNAELCLSERSTLATGRTPKEALETKGSKNDAATQKAKQIADTRNAPQLKEGDKVWLLTKNLRSKRPSKKLDHVKVGPFLVDKQKPIPQGQQRVSYRLKLPQDARVHPVFHVSLLEPAHPSVPLQRTFRFEPDEENEYEVEKVLNMSTSGKEFLVKWKGYPSSENTWEPYQNLVNCRQTIVDYMSSLDGTEQELTAEATASVLGRINEATLGHQMYDHHQGLLRARNRNRRRRRTGQGTTVDHLV